MKYFTVITVKMLVDNKHLIKMFTDNKFSYEDISSYVEQKNIQYNSVVFCMSRSIIYGGKKLNDPRFNKYFTCDNKGIKEIIENIYTDVLYGLNDFKIFSDQIKFLKRVIDINENKIEEVYDTLQKYKHRIFEIDDIYTFEEFEDFDETITDENYSVLFYEYFNILDYHKAKFDELIN